MNKSNTPNTKDSPSSLRAADYQPPRAGGVAQSSWQLGWQHLALISAIAVLALFVLFLIFARSIQVTAQADNFLEGEPRLTLDADVDLDSWLKLPIGNRFLVLPGSQSVDVTVPGFKDGQNTLTVDDERFQQFEIKLERLPGILDVSLITQPSDRAETIIEGAQLSISDVVLGAVPGVVVDVPAGRNVLTVDAPLYRKVSQDFTVLGQAQTQQLSFSLEPAWASYQFSSNQTGVSLSIDAKVVGELPMTLRLEEGAHEIEYTKPLFEPLTQNIVVTAGEDVVVPSVALRPAPSLIEISSKPLGAAVLVNSEYRGLTPIKLKLTSKTSHNLQLYKPGYKLAEQSLELEPEQSATIDLALVADTVAVTLSVSPANAQVSINGKDLEVAAGVSKRTLNLPTLAQTIKVSAPGYVTQTQSIIPTTAGSQIVSFELLTHEQDYWARLPDQYKNAAGDTMLLFKAPGLVSMGSSRREIGRRSNEVQYAAELSKAFYVSTLETTNRQYRQFKSAHSSGNYQRNSLDLNSYPVVRVSWQQAALYCNWLSEREKLEPFYTTKSGFVSGHNPKSNGYRLLTEAEWTWLASHDSTSRKTFPWGDSQEFPKGEKFGNVADEQARNLINFMLEGYDDGYKTAAAVGSFSANAKGLFDLYGNVAEWTHDWYGAQGSKPSDGSTVVDPLGPNIGEYRVVKGPSWARGYLPQLRLAYRDSTAKGRHDIGFRVARYAHP